MLKRAEPAAAFPGEPQPPRKRASLPSPVSLPASSADGRRTSPSPLLDGLALAAAQQLAAAANNSNSNSSTAAQDLSGLSVLLSGIESLEGTPPRLPQSAAMPTLPSFATLLLQASPTQRRRSSGTSTPASLETEQMDDGDTAPGSPGAVGMGDVLPADGISLELDKQLKGSDELVISIRSPCVAQKSYGLEKRFLCPPPALQAIGRNSAVVKQFVRVSIVSDDGARGVNQQAVTDEHGRCHFKYLHVTDSFKSRQFVLRFKVNGSDGSPASVPQDSRPITIISKPSKKTSKSGSNAMAIVSGATVCLFNRVNSQTVRTKYMTVDQGRLCGKNTSWSTFEILAMTPVGVDTAASVITYGSPVVLRNVETGVYSDVLVIKKVTKDVILHDAAGPVSQMQKVALLHSGAPNLCLSIMPHGAIGNGTPYLCFQPVVDGRRLDNHMPWTIVGIDKTQFRISLAGPTPERTQLGDVTLQGDALEISGENLAACAVVFSLPNGSVVRLPGPSWPHVIVTSPPKFLLDPACASAAQPTPFGVSLTVGVSLEHADGTLRHTGRFLVYERVGPAPPTVRLISP